jgi:hypothetical protein
MNCEPDKEDEVGLLVVLREPPCESGFAFRFNSLHLPKRRRFGTCKEFIFQAKRRHFVGLFLI